MLILTVTNYGSAMQTAIPYLLCVPGARWENIFGRLTPFICLRKNHLLWPWRKSHRSLLWGFSPSLLHGPGVVVGSIRPISDCTAPLGTASSLLRAQKRKAMNSWSCLSLLPELAGLLCRISQTQHEKCLLLKLLRTVMKHRKGNRVRLMFNILHHFLNKSLQKAGGKRFRHFGLYNHKNSCSFKAF